MREEALRAALLDLAHYGIIYLTNASDVRAVREATTLPTQAFFRNRIWSVELKARRPECQGMKNG